jgi:hypothetical protein
MTSLIYFVEDVTMLRKVIAQSMYNAVVTALKAQSFYSRRNVSVTDIEPKQKEAMSRCVKIYVWAS